MGAGRCRGAGSVRPPEREARRSEVASMNEGPDAGAQLLPVSEVTTGLLQAASAFSLILSEVSASGRPAAPCGDGGPDLGLPSRRNLSGSCVTGV